MVFDLHGEYGPLTEPGGGEPVARGLRVAGPADLGRESASLLYLPYWLLDRDEFMTLVSDPDDPHAADQLLRFAEHVKTLKHIALVDAGREDAVNTFTVDSPIPYRLEHLVAKLQHNDTEKIPQHPANRVVPGPYYGRLTRFLARLQARAADPRYGFIFDPPQRTFGYEWFTETAAMLLGADAARPGSRSSTSRRFPARLSRSSWACWRAWCTTFRSGRTPGSACPCAWCATRRICTCRRARSARGPVPARWGPLKRSRRRAASTGVGLVVVTQRPSDVNRTILSQCNNFIVMRTTNDHDHATIERLVPDTLSGVKGVLPALDVGEAVVIGDALLLPSLVKFDPAPGQARQRDAPLLVAVDGGAPQPGCDTCRRGGDAHATTRRSTDAPASRLGSER